MLRRQCKEISFYYAHYYLILFIFKILIINLTQSTKYANNMKYLNNKRLHIMLSFKFHSYLDWLQIQQELILGQIYQKISHHKSCKKIYKKWLKQLLYQRK
ncbi:transmembrane protein, putative (macronuclear) [Tetrahymena thermophila SB210]|uniref:Transmembrane protein, putative n=1 Tax=Tetrahymena thermophila (strain SB210) TaxID=312017 RepID=W7X0Z6_TETTS|nr:transmembrane protein, putative [Tetrahymena thermophila SB210]EWS72825.1 transmembrane protein, putative [Tetrahymena thermophila SB210]|eukprot:XP_012654651.1 transmembrane protein, putative [Tetrahymena thermophila SB210]